MPTIKVKKLEFEETRNNIYCAYQMVNQYAIKYTIDVASTSTQLRVTYGDSDKNLLMTCLVDSYDDAIDAANEHLRLYVMDNVIVEIVEQPEEFIMC